MRLSKTFNRVMKQKGFIYVSSGTLLYTGLAGVFWFILAVLLPVSDYGFVNYILSIASICSSISTLGLKTTIITYYPKEEKNQLLSQAYIVTFTASLLLLIILFIMNQLIAGILVIVEVSFGMFAGELLGRRLYKEYALVSSATRILQIILSIALYMVFKLPGIFSGYIIAFTIFSIPYFKKLLKPQLQLSEVKNKIGFTAFSYAHDLTGVLASYFDKVLIGLTLGLTILGLYQLAYQVYWILAVLPAALLNYLLPERSGGSISREVEILGVLLSIGLAAAAILAAPILIPLLFPSFTASISITQIISLAIIPSTWVSIRKAKVFSEEKPLHPLIANITSIITEIILILTLPSIIGELGLAAAILISQTIMALTLEYFNTKNKKSAT